MIEWYCQMVATSPDSDIDHLIAKEEIPLQHVRTGKNGVTGPADTMVAGDLGADGTNENVLALTWTRMKVMLPESDHEESETFPPQVRNCGEVGGEMETKTKGYSANLIAVGSEDTHLPDDDETSVTGGRVAQP